MAASELVERIRKAAKDQRVSQTRLAEVAGLPSQSAVSNIFRGSRKLGLEEAAKLRSFLKLEEGPAIQWIPVIGLAAAGCWNEAVQLPIRRFPMVGGVAGDRAFGVEIKGDSMDKLLPEGGWAVVDPDQRRLYAGRVYLIENEDHETTVKRYVGDPARFEPVSNNPLHTVVDLAEKPYSVIGRVVSYGNTAGL
jgi:SOS-response transcriptional repressor LexA